MTPGYSPFCSGLQSCTDPSKVDSYAMGGTSNTIITGEVSTVDPATEVKPSLPASWNSANHGIPASGSRSASPLAQPAKINFEGHPFIKALITAPIEEVSRQIEELGHSFLRSFCCPVTGATPLFFAVQRRNDEEAFEICKLLIEEHKLYVAATVDRNQQTALFFATRDGNHKTCMYLCENGCSPSHRDNSLQTPLFYGCREGRKELVADLITKFNGNPNLTDSLNQTCLFYAVRENHIDLVRYLVEESLANIHIKDKRKQDVLRYASKIGRHEIVAFLKSFQQSQPRPKFTKHGSSSSIQKTTVKSDITAPRQNIYFSKPDITSHDVLNTQFSTPLSGTPTNTNTSCTTYGNMPQRKRCRLQFLYEEGETEEKNGNNDSVGETSPGLKNPVWLFAPPSKISEFEDKFPGLATWSKTSEFPKLSSAAYKIPNDEKSSNNGDTRCILKVFREKNGLDKTIPELSNVFIYEWTAVAYNIMLNISKYEGGWIFEKAVDSKRLNCPDYYLIIKEPMDFTTIKSKLKHLAYNYADEFLRDVKLVFKNCYLYNKQGSWVALHGHSLETYFNNLRVTKNFTKYENRSAKIKSFLAAAEGAANPVGDPLLGGENELAKSDNNCGKAESVGNDKTERNEKNECGNHEPNGVDQPGGTECEEHEGNNSKSEIPNLENHQSNIADAPSSANSETDQSVSRPFTTN